MSIAKHVIKDAPGLEEMGICFLHQLPHNLFNIDAVNVKQIPNPQNSAILDEWIKNSL